ncbi:MAG: hypothetical protein JOY71_10910 [Acetobacteraceae bacterium]|nr:hypothetical protein [Acetobacteraceae bacterium]
MPVKAKLSPGPAFAAALTRGKRATKRARHPKPAPGPQPGAVDSSSLIIHEIGQTGAEGLACILEKICYQHQTEVPSPSGREGQLIMLTRNNARS